MIRRRLAAGALATIWLAHLSACNAQKREESVEEWVKRYAIPIATVEARDQTSDLRHLASVIGTARVILLGEPAHGAHEPLAFRNRLFQYLVSELGFTAIAIESGLPEARSVQGFIAGEPGDAMRTVHDNLTWGFGAYLENVELVRWIRQHNAAPERRRKVRFYGIDVSILGADDFRPSRASVDAALSYLDRGDSRHAQLLRARFEPLLDRLSNAASVSLSPVEHDALTAAIDDLISSLESERPSLIASSESDYEWGLRNAIVARQSDRLFRVAPPNLPNGQISAAGWRFANVRDSAMAENVRWILAQEGPTGRVLVFAHNVHVMNAQTKGGMWAVFDRPPYPMGMHLRSLLGDDVLIIATSSAANGQGLPVATPDSDSVDAALARVGLPRFLLDLRRARNEKVEAWLTQPRALRANFDSHVMVSPGTAFDALLFINTLTPALTFSP
jgi:erythromycin esterase